MPEQWSSIQTVSPTKVFVAVVDDQIRLDGFKLIKELRQHGISADIDYESKSLKAQMRLADRLKAEYVVVIGPEEINKNIVRIKQMSTGLEKEISRPELVNYVKGGKYA